MQHIQKELEQFIQDGGSTYWIIGIDHQGTSLEGLMHLLNMNGNHVWINKTSEPYITFHPKVY